MNGRNSGNFIKFIFQTCSYCYHWVWTPGNVIFSITHIIARLRKNPENKKCKILDKRCFNVQRHHQKSAISPTRPENVPKYKGFCIDFRSSRRHSMAIWWLCTLKHRLSRILHFLFSGFFLSQCKYIRMPGIMRTDSGTLPVAKRRGLIEKTKYFLE